MFVSSRTPQEKSVVPTSNAVERTLAASPPTPLATDPLHDQLQLRLKAASQGLGLARLQLRSGQTEDAEETFGKLHDGFQQWRKRLECQARQTLPQPAPRRMPKVLLVEDDSNQREVLAGLPEVAGTVTQSSILDGLEARFPMLRGTIRDHGSAHRPMPRFFACAEDYSPHPPDHPLPNAVASGAEPFWIVGAIAGG